MGLEIVELVLSMEEAFDIEIPDEEAETLLTVGQMYACVLSKLGRDRMQTCLSSVVFYRTRRALIDINGVPRSSVILTADLERLLPVTHRARNWQRLEQTLGLRLPALMRPAWMNNLVTTVFAVSLMISILAWMLQCPAYIPVSLVTGGILFSWLTLRMLQPYAVQLPAGCLSIREAVGTILALNVSVLLARRRPRNDREVWEVLHRIIIKQLGVSPDSVTKESRFVDDLGVG